MNDDPMTRFSIKQRLRSNNHSFQQNNPQTAPQSPRTIHVPEHYNYFLQTIQKQLNHETHTFKRIKRKINNFRQLQQQKIKIKNSYSYAHQRFPTPAPKKHQKKQNTIPKKPQNAGEDIAQSQKYTISTNQSEYLAAWNRLDRTKLTSAKSNASFVRSPQNTLYKHKQNIAQKFNAWLSQNRNISQQFIRTSHPNKENKLEVMGAKPKWTAFQSYRTSYNNALKQPF